MGKILIVDDELAIANTLAIIFANAGYDARAASSAEQALELIADGAPIWLSSTWFCLK
jgi:DNA-binding response OmpR family regulator